MALLRRDPSKRPTARDVAAQLAKADVTQPKPVRSSRAFVGREQELKTLLRAGERARHTPTVTGASGIGKTLCFVARRDRSWRLRCTRR